jgi:hypothetical protein
MNPDFLLPVITSIAWLILACVGFASYRLKWSQMIKMALVWVVIFLGIYLIAEWFMVARNTASAVILI